MNDLVFLLVLLVVYLSFLYFYIPVLILDSSFLVFVKLMISILLLEYIHSLFLGSLDLLQDLLFFFLQQGDSIPQSQCFPLDILGSSLGVEKFTFVLAIILVIFFTSRPASVFASATISISSSLADASSRTTRTHYRF